MYNKFNNKPASVILLSVLLLGVLYMYIYQSSRGPPGLGDGPPSLGNIHHLLGAYNQFTSVAIACYVMATAMLMTPSSTCRSQQVYSPSLALRQPMTVVWLYHPFTQGAPKPDFSPTTFHAGGTAYQPQAVSFEQQVMATDGRSAEVHVKTHGLHLVAPDHLQYQQPSIVKGRNDVVSVTPWLAPIVWEGTFNPVLLDGIYKAKNITVAATVFAVGKYIMFLKNFLETAEQHFFVGFNVHIYVFTDRPGEVPQVKMAAGRQLTVRSVPSSNRWQEISAGRMELIQVLIEEELRNHIDYIFCLDVDCQFHGRWGTESLGDLLTVIHPGYYLDDRSKFPYERRPQSRAYIAAGEGDFYYCAAVFGGLIEEVHQLAKTCRTNFEADAKEGIEAAWQDESHLNRYMWINKPTKLLSPEYLWQDFKPQNPEIHIIRFSTVIKNYTEIRPNV